MKQRRFSVSMNTPTYLRMRRIAEHRGCSMSRLLQDLIDKTTNDLIDELELQPFEGLDGTEVGDSEPEVGDSEPEVGDSEPEVGDSEPEVGDSEPRTNAPVPEADGAEPSADGPASRNIESDAATNGSEPQLRVRRDRPNLVPAYQIRGELVVKPALEPKPTEDPHGGGTQLW
jgi:hypothetical protein